MNSPVRTELLASLAELLRQYPNWRLGQLLANISGWADKDIWEAEDAELLDVCRAHLEQLGTQEREVHA